MRGPSQEAQRARLIELEVPYKAAYAYEEVLATFLEDPASRSGVQAAYRVLAGVITGEGPVDARPVPEEERQRVLWAFEQYGPPAPRSVAVFGAPEDRPWVDWLVSVLGPTGVQVRSVPPTSRAATDFPAVDALVVVGSPNLGLDTPGEAALRAVVQARGRAGVGRAAASIVQVGATRLDSAYTGAEMIGVTTLAEREAAVEVLERLGLPVLGTGIGDLTAVTPRYPTHRPRIWTMPTLFNQRFVGRHALLDGLRDRLLPGARATGPALLLGGEGIGQSAVAAQFAHRFDADYDIVHWIPAGDETSVRRSLADLAVLLRPDSSVPQAQRSPSEQLERVALDALRHGDPSPRWLLVYDGAGHPETLTGLLPTVTPNGHVLITSSASGWRDQPDAIWVDPFEPEESLAFLRQWLPAVDRERLELLAERLDHRPSGLRTAVGRLRQDWRGAEIDGHAVDAYLAQAVGARAETMTWTVSFETLRSAASPMRRAAARLLQLCAFLSAQGVPLALLESPMMLRHLAEEVGDDMIADPTVLPELWEEIRKPRLAEVDAVPEGQVRLAARWQRLLVERMSPAEQEATRAAVLGVFADIALAAPRPADAASWPTYRQLEEQVLPAGAIDSPSSRVRQWLVDQVYAMWRSGRLEVGRDMAQQALDRWRKLFGSDDPLTLRMATHLAILLRDLGRFQLAYDLDTDTLDTDTLARQRHWLGIHHRHTLITAMSYGVDIRELGRFAMAAAEDSSTLIGLRRTLGDNHLNTLMAAGNLALSTFLDGRPRQALDLSLDTLGRLRLVGAADTGQFWWLQARAGICHRELGDLETAEEMLREAAANLARIEGENTHLTLRCNKHLAVALRLRGSPDTAEHLAAQTLARYVDVYGEADLGSIACRLSHAGHLHALGQHHEAVVEAQACLHEYLRLHGQEHPFTNLCRSNLSIYLRADGRPAEALVLAEQGYQLLAEELYLHHPFTLAAGVNLVAASIAVGAIDEAHRLAGDLLAEAKLSLDRAHPRAPGRSF